VNYWSNKSKRKWRAQWFMHFTLSIKETKNKMLITEMKREAMKWYSLNTLCQIYDINTFHFCLCSL
jgi:hypothetical protein